MRERSSFGPTVLVGAGAAALAAVSANQPWAEATTRAQGLRAVSAAGTDVAPLAMPLALVALAAWGAVLVLRRRGRRSVAVLGILAGVGAAVTAALQAREAPDVAMRLLGDVGDRVATDTSTWPVATIVAGVLTALAFVVALAKAPRWPEMSSRYDAPRAGSVDHPSDADLWKALDEGRDPTV